MASRDKSGDGSRQWEEWSRQLDHFGAVEFVAGRRVIARVDADGVLLPTRDLLVRWMHLGFADGDEYSGLDAMPSTLTLTVSRPWWEAHIATSTGRERRRAEREFTRGWATPTVSFMSLRRVPVESFGEWLSAQAIVRAPIPEHFYLTPASETPVFDRDTNRPVPLSRLPIGQELRSRLAAWGAAAEAVPRAELAEEATWERFLPEGRLLAAGLQAETMRPAAVWKDCPEVP